MATPKQPVKPATSAKALRPTIKPLDFEEERKKLATMYEENANNKKVNVLLLGESGTGKSFLGRTAPGLTHVDSFDPGGTTCLREEIQKGQIIADTRWENEDPWDPKQFREWEKEMEYRIAGGYFTHVQNYWLDSCTTWSAAIMNQVLKQAGIPGQTPRFTHDYGPQKAAIQNWLKRLLALPCNVIITGHLKIDQDGDSGIVTKRFMTTGQNAVLIPLLFDEIWVMDPKKTSSGLEYRILTKATGRDLARSRLAAGNLLEQYEKPDFSAILRKAKLLT